MTLRLGIDIGGTKTHALLLEGGAVRSEATRPTDRGEDAIVAVAVEAAVDACRQAGVTMGEVTSVGVGIPGQVDPARGIVRTAVNLGIADVDLGGRLTRELGRPVWVDNDVKAAALGASHLLGPDGYDLTLINVGTGIAAATVAGRHLVRGAGNQAGEIGHLSVNPAGDPCGCGQRGCLEIEAGGGAVSARLAAHGLTLPGLMAAADAGDAVARAEADRLSAGIAFAIQVMVLAEGSARVILTGGVIHHTTGLVDAVRALLTRRAASSGFLTSVAFAGRIMTLAPDSPVAAIGAARVGASGGVLNGRLTSQVK